RQIDFSELTHLSQPPEPTPLKKDTKLWMALLNMRTLGNLTDIRSFSLDEELKQNSPANSSAAASSSTSNLKQVSLALLMYVQDYVEVLPPMKNPQQTKKVLMPYVKNEKVFVQPETKEPYVPNPVLSHKRVKQIANPAQFVVFYEASPINGTRGVAFLAGHVKRVSESEWARLKRASKIS